MSDSGKLHELKVVIRAALSGYKRYGECKV